MTKRMQVLPLLAGLAFLPAGVAEAHVGVGAAASFAAGVQHPLGGLDHLTVMLAVGLWAALKGGRALWVWPASFVAAMLAGGALAMAQMQLPFVEPGILASVVALGTLVALAVDLPIWSGGAIIGLFALFHGHAHGTEAPATVGGIEYMLGFATATAGLHLAGIGIGAGVSALRWRGGIRAAGALCVASGIGMLPGVIGA